jgi:hypothetical protein
MIDFAVVLKIVPWVDIVLREVVIFLTSVGPDRAGQIVR